MAEPLLLILALLLALRPSRSILRYLAVVAVVTFLVSDDIAVVVEVIVPVAAAVDSAASAVSEALAAPFTASEDSAFALRRSSPPLEELPPRLSRTPPPSALVGP